MIVGIMADRSSVIGLTREYRPNWSFPMILCRDFDRPQLIRIAKVALHCKLIWKRVVKGLHPKCGVGIFGCLVVLTSKAMSYERLQIARVGGLRN